MTEPTITAENIEVNEVAGVDDNGTKFWTVNLFSKSEMGAEGIKSYLLDCIEKAKQFDYMIPWLRLNLTKQQLDELSTISDKVSRKILAYLAKDETGELK